MPSRNVIKVYAPDSYYHVYNRGVGKQTIFHDEQDYTVFLGLLKRHLDAEPHQDRQGRQYDHLYDDVELLAYCLMPNHFHLLLYLKEPGAITRLLRGMSTAYTMYYNKRYTRVGGLFQGTYKASRITTDDYLTHISRYIHLNPAKPLDYRWSSLDYYLGRKQAQWVKPEKILDMFKNSDEYRQFVQDYEEQNQMTHEIKQSVADK
jgi:REP element-mobilizing transposase RayT